MTEAEFASLALGDEVVVNPVELMSEHDIGCFPYSMRQFIGRTYRVHSRSTPTTIRLMDESGNDIGWYWYPTMISEAYADEDIQPLSEADLKGLIYGI